MFLILRFNFTHLEPLGLAVVERIDRDETSLVRASDLVGCRYRLRQRLTHPSIPPLPDAVERQPQIDAGRAAVWVVAEEEDGGGWASKSIFCCAS